MLQNFSYLTQNLQKEYEQKNEKKVNEIPGQGSELLQRQTRTGIFLPCHSF
jgi:hypothetical protein